MSHSFGNPLVEADIGITANGTTNASTAVLHSFYNEIDTSTSAAYACVLPLQPVLGQKYKLKNNGAYQVLVFPADPSSGSSTIDGGASFCLANNGASVTFVAMSETLSSGDNHIIAWHSFNMSGHGIISTAASITLLACPKFKMNVVALGAAAITVTLPTPVGNGGMIVDVIKSGLAGVGGQDITVSSTASLVDASLINAGVVLGSTEASTSVVIEDAASRGTTLHLESNNIAWAGYGTSEIASGFSVA